MNSAKKSSGTKANKIREIPSQCHSSSYNSCNEFQVIKEISRGTMSTVYYCEGKIALKTMGEEECFNEPSDAVTIYKNDLKVLQSVG